MRLDLVGRHNSYMLFDDILIMACPELVTCLTKLITMQLKKLSKYSFSSKQCFCSIRDIYTNK